MPFYLLQATNIGLIIQKKGQLAGLSLDDTIDVEYYAYQKTIPAGATNFSYTFMIH